jgi:murein DD-endopeptidase MepM/ murein hydrolase activator NlpD
MVIAPVPLAPLTFLGAVGVAGHGLWSGFSLNTAFSSGQAWSAAVTATLAIVAAIAAPFTGVPTPMTGTLVFPLREGRWLVAEGQGRIFNHHWGVPDQREALDLVRLRWTGRSRRGLGRHQQDFPAFGTELLAPCTGIVVHAQDGLPDGVLDLANVAGNHVIIDNGHELIELAHLRQSTVAVRTGDYVRAGDRIGEVGNSGNSAEPHLHIQASRNGQPLRLRFSDVTGRLGQGRIIVISRQRRQRAPRGM